MAITIKDVAKAAGVSVSTVSKILNNSGSISQNTIDRVNSVITELHYTPNSRAVSLQKEVQKVLFFDSAWKRRSIQEPTYVRHNVWGLQRTFKK